MCIYIYPTYRIYLKPPPPGSSHWKQRLLQKLIQQCQRLMGWSTGGGLTKLEAVNQKNMGKTTRNALPKKETKRPRNCDYILKGL